MVKLCNQVKCRILVTQLHGHPGARQGSDMPTIQMFACMQLCYCRGQLQIPHDVATAHSWWINSCHSRHTIRKSTSSRQQIQALYQLAAIELLAASSVVGVHLDGTCGSPVRAGQPPTCRILRGTCTQFQLILHPMCHLLLPNACDGPQAACRQTSPAPSS